MLSFTSKSEKSSFCAIMDENTNKIISKVKLLDKKECKGKNDKKLFSELTLPDDKKFQLIPNKSKERDVLYICGMSGSGKSYFIKDYCKQYIKEFPKRDIFLFSFLKEDKTLDEISKIQRINIYHKDFMEEDIAFADFKDSLVIFDDIDALADKKLKKKVFNILQQILQLGRHDSVSVCFACHEVVNRDETKPILNECHSISIPVRSLGNKKLEYVLGNYFGFDKAQIQKFRSVDSRFTTIIKSYPKVVIGEKEIYLL